MRICLYNDNGVSVIYNTDTAGLERLDKNDLLMDGVKPRRAICEIGMIDVPDRLVIPNLFGGAVSELWYDGLLLKGVRLDSYNAPHSGLGVFILREGGLYFCYLRAYSLDWHRIFSAKQESMGYWTYKRREIL